MPAEAHLLRLRLGGNKASKDLRIDSGDPLDVLLCLWTLCVKLRNELLDQAPELRLVFVRWCAPGTSFRQLRPQPSEDMEDLAPPSWKTTRRANRPRQLQKSGEVGCKVREDGRSRSELEGR